MRVIRAVAAETGRMDEKIAAGRKIARIAVISPPHSSQLLAERIIIRRGSCTFSRHVVVDRKSVV